ncbi:unnamed protein product [Pleuronectes platessa]|uniref:Uncharacterized protein n=1 Tax=Pleuronectes platessa TaxID=8262 RepID=A0A9N7VZ59_PLEPL|nr:unnamed protein product [Pleuronectes platessa]
MSRRPHGRRSLRQKPLAKKKKRKKEQQQQTQAAMNGRSRGLYYTGGGGGGGRTESEVRRWHLDSSCMQSVGTQGMELSEGRLRKTDQDIIGVRASLSSPFLSRLQMWPALLYRQSRQPSVALFESNSLLPW